MMDHASHLPPGVKPGNSTESSAEWVVEGMTCGHCVQTVSDAIQAVPSVDRATVDLKKWTGHRLLVEGYLAGFLRRHQRHSIRRLYRKARRSFIAHGQGGPARQPMET